MKEHFGEIIRKARLKKDLSLRDVSDLNVGISYSYVNKLEQGLSTPSRQIVLSLSKVLGIPEDKALIAAGYLPENHEYICDQPNKDVYWLMQEESPTYKGNPISEEQKKEILKILDKSEQDTDAAFARELVANMQSEYGKKPSDQLVAKLTNIHKRLKAEVKNKE